MRSLTLAFARIQVHIVDATPRVQNNVQMGAPPRIEDMIAQLGQQINELHQNFTSSAQREKEDTNGLLQAMAQRAQTDRGDLEAMLNERDQLQVERSQSMEKHFLESLSLESTNFSKLHQHHLDSTEVRLQDVEKRVTTRAESGVEELKKMHDSSVHVLRDQVAQSSASVERLGEDLKSEVKQAHEEGMTELREKVVQTLVPCARACHHINICVHICDRSEHVCAHRACVLLCSVSVLNSGSSD